MTCVYVCVVANSVCVCEVAAEMVCRPTNHTRRCLVVVDTQRAWRETGGVGGLVLA
jgi:hypothetical protein